MESFLSTLDWKALGVGGLLTAYAMYQSHLARADSKEDKAYARSQNDLVHNVVNRLIVVVEKLEQTIRDSDK